MADMDFPAPTEGFVLTHFLVVADQDRSRRWYEQVLGAKTVLDRDPVIMKVANSWIILNVGGGPTEDKPVEERYLRSPEEIRAAAEAVARQAEGG